MSTSREEGPDPEGWAGYCDLAITTIEIHLGWTDRLRVLVGAPLNVKLRLYTEHVIGMNKSVTEVHCLWPWVRWWRNRQPHIGYVVEQ